LHFAYAQNGNKMHYLLLTLICFTGEGKVFPVPKPYSVQGYGMHDGEASHSLHKEKVQSVEK
jgi:hypothetical protein